MDSHPPRRLPIPFFRLGLLLAVGAMAASLFRYYLALGQAAADLRGPDLPANCQAAYDQFLRDFLFSGTTPGLLFWAGMLVMALGILRNLRAAARR